MARYSQTAKGSAARTPWTPNGQEGSVAFGQLHGGSGRRIGPDIHRVFAEIDERNRADEEDDEDRDREQRDDDRDGEG